MYLPFPESVNVTKTVTASYPATECVPKHSISATASFSMPKSTVSREKMADSVHFERTCSTDGSWQQIKKSGSIKMTPMSVVNEKTTYSVGQVNMPFLRHAIARTGNMLPRINGKCVPCGGVVAWSCKAAIVKGSYVEQGDLSYWKSKYPEAPHYEMSDGILDENELEAKKSEAYAELFQAYNLGEEIAELRETIAGVTKLTSEAVSLILRFRTTIANLLEKDKLIEAGSRWMEFRYGIMPIMFSIQDILNLRTEGLYRTVRKTVSPEVSMPEEVGSEPIYFQDVGMNEIRASITAKGRWATENLKNFDMININPLTTTTAVLPWAMVVRWFFNVQSYIDCRVKSLTSLALESHACVAIREKREYGTYLHITAGYPSTRIFDSGDSGTCGAGFYGVTEFGTYEDLQTQNVLLAWHSVNNYTRYLYQPSDVKLVFNPYISWQRSTDAFVLMMGSMSKLLRRLK